ncbi:MAG TPA: hypothetical protein VMN78_07965 [Longimicrobiales bacterium]|nr:hypothetical protein [Longimicrobiales bacterium]
MPLPYARLRLKPTPRNRIREVYVDPELGNMGFTYVLESGEEDSLMLDAVLDYNEDPDYMRELMLHRLTCTALDRIKESGLAKREIIRRLGTSASQFYRLIDPTNYSKSVDQMLALLRALDCDVDVVVKKRVRKSA